MRQPVEVEGTVIELLPSALCRVELESRHRSSSGKWVTAHHSADLRKNFIRILVGDRVRVRLSPHDLSRGCIVQKM
jgi:translation initiation factor IF-1